MELLHLRTPGGQVIGFSTPVHDAIAKQWANGELVRVQADGSAWDGDDGYDAQVAAAEPDGDQAVVDQPDEPEVEETEHDEEDGDEEDGGREPAAKAHQPKRPGPKAHQRTWAKYAVALGVVSEADAEDMDRAELIRLATPPELKPEG